MKELLLTFILALVIGSIINGYSQLPPSSETASAGSSSDQSPATTSTNSDQTQSAATNSPKLSSQSQIAARARSTLSSESNTAAAKSLTSTALVLESSESSFDNDVIRSDRPVLVEFGAKWCGPCQQMSPILSEIAAENAGKLKVVKVDVDDNNALSEQYAQGGLPTFILFQGGQVKQMFVGFTPKPELMNIVKSYISAPLASSLARSAR